jgi:hypothetical protein
MNHGHSCQIKQRRALFLRTRLQVSKLVIKSIAYLRYHYIIYIFRRRLRLWAAIAGCNCFMGNILSKKYCRFPREPLPHHCRLGHGPRVLRANRVLWCSCFPYDLSFSCPWQLARFSASNPFCPVPFAPLLSSIQGLPPVYTKLNRTHTLLNSTSLELKCLHPLKIMNTYCEATWLRQRASR